MDAAHGITLQGSVPTAKMNLQILLLVWFFYADFT